MNDTPHEGSSTPDLIQQIEDSPDDDYYCYCDQRGHNHIDSVPEDDYDDYDPADDCVSRCVGGCGNAIGSGSKGMAHEEACILVHGIPEWPRFSMERHRLHAEITRWLTSYHGEPRFDTVTYLLAWMYYEAPEVTVNALHVLLQTSGEDPEPSLITALRDAHGAEVKWEEAAKATGADMSVLF